MEEGVVGADFREKLRAIYGERRFNCDVTCNASNGASFTTSFSRHNIETGVGRHVSYLTSFHCRYLLRRYLKLKFNIFIQAVSPPAPKAERFYRFPVVPELAVQSPLHATSRSPEQPPRCRLRCDDDELTRALTLDRDPIHQKTNSGLKHVWFEGSISNPRHIATIPMPKYSMMLLVWHYWQLIWFDIYTKSYNYLLLVLFSYCMIITW